MIQNRQITILYGSQTGTSQDLAEEIWRESKKYYFNGPVTAMDDYCVSGLINERIVIFICSTTGQGDEPDNMKIFWKFLLRKNLPKDSLNSMWYAVLGLGDSSYAKFNFVAKKLNKRLAQLGANCLVPIGLCDDQHDLGAAAVSVPWMASLWTKLLEISPLPDGLSPLSISPRQFRWNIYTPGIDNTENFIKPDLDRDLFKGSENIHYEHPYTAVVKGNVRTTAPDHFQDVRLLTFSQSPVEHGLGDVLMIRPKNNPCYVSELFNLFEEHHIPLLPETIVYISEIDDGPQAAGAAGGVSGGANTQESQDDEYRYAGCEDPKIMITTSRDPSSRLKMFAKEIRLIFPNAQRMNRGNYEMKQLIHACRANDVTDFIIIHETRGVPDTLVVCHLPYGPTASFTLSGVVMRHDIPDIGPMSEQKPHLIFHNFKTEIGLRCMSILKYLFPVPKEDAKRVMTFANHDDYISFRHHTYKKVDKQIEMTEVGPRFQLKLYDIKLGTLDALEAAESQYQLRPFMNTAFKRRFLSNDDGWAQDDVQ